MDDTQPPASEASPLQMNVMGASRNPEYNLGVTSPRFKRRQDGKRIAPVSQLNTYTGRMLAREQTTKTDSYTEGLARPAETTQHARLIAENASAPQVERHEKAASSLFRNHSGDVLSEMEHARSDIPTNNNLSDRDRLTSQRPRTELSQLLGMTRSSSRKGTIQSQKEANPASTTKPPCSECGQSEANHKASTSFSHICNTCRRFVPAKKITALQISTSADRPLPAEPAKPAPPSKAPRSVKCNTCLPIPSYLYEEYLRFFPPCAICGYMTDMTLADLVAHEGEVKGISDKIGKRVYGPSKELQDWCVYVVFSSRSVSRHDSKKSVAESIASTESSRLRRRGAVKRAGTGSTRSSIASAGSGKSTHPGLIPLDEGGRDIRYARQFSFDALPKQESSPCSPTQRQRHTSDHPDSPTYLPFHGTRRHSVDAHHMRNVPQARGNPMVAASDQSTRPMASRTFSDMFGEERQS